MVRREIEMICPKCGGKTKQNNGSVKNKEIPEVYRCRICEDCKHVFYTLEVVVPYEGEFKKKWREQRKAIEDKYLAKRIMRELKGE